MNLLRKLSSFVLAGALLITPMTAAFAVEEQAAEQSVQQTAQEVPSQTTETAFPTEEENPVDENGDPTIELSAGAAICVNAQTGQVIYKKHSLKKMYPASTTKVMTALLTLENCDDLQTTVLMEKADFTDVEGGASTAGFTEGENVTVEDLLYGLMLPSGNEAANALARFIGGDIAGFADMMNKRAEELGCKNSHFINPNGLHNDNHYTCAYDLYLIAQEAMSHEIFRTIVNTAQHRVSATNKSEERIIYTTNELIKSRYSPLYYDRCYGIKTGHTTPAGYCLVSYAKNSDDSVSYYSVVLGAPYMDAKYAAGSFIDTKELFQWAFGNFHMYTAGEEGTAISECKVRLGKDKDSVTLVTESDVTAIIPDNANTDDIKLKIKAQESYEAPINAGDKLGKVTYYYHGHKLASTNLIALTSIERSQFLFYLDQIKNALLSPIAMAIIIILVALMVILYFVHLINKRNRRKKMLRRKKARARQMQARSNASRNGEQEIEIRRRSLDKNKRK